METVDEALREYLLFRGFTHTLRTFEAELRHDKDKAFQVTTTLFIISDHQFHCIIAGFLHTYSFLRLLLLLIPL